MEQLDLPRVQLIDYNVFSNCVFLKQIVAPKLKQCSGFDFCSQLELIELPSLQCIGKFESQTQGGFAFCSKLKSLKLPLLNAIDNGAFRACALKFVNLESLRWMHVNSFAECKIIKFHAPKLEEITQFNEEYLCTCEAEEFVTSELTLSYQIFENLSSIQLYQMLKSVSIEKIHCDFDENESQISNDHNLYTHSKTDCQLCNGTLQAFFS